MFFNKQQRILQVIRYEHQRNDRLVSKTSVVMNWWASELLNLETNRLISVKFPPRRDNEGNVLSVYSFVRANDEGLIRRECTLTKG